MEIKTIMRVTSMVAFVASCLLIINFWSMIYNWHNALIPFLIIPFILSYVKVYRDYCDFPDLWMSVGIVCGAVLIWSSTVIDSRLGMWRSVVWTFISGEASPTWETTGLLFTGILCIVSVVMARYSIQKFISELINKYNSSTIPNTNPIDVKSQTPKIPRSQDLCSVCRNYIWGWGEPLGQSLDKQNVPLLEPKGAIIFNSIYPAMASELEESDPNNGSCGCVGMLRKAIKNYNDWLEEQ